MWRKLFYSVFTTKLGWLVITLLLCVLLGWKSSVTIDEESQLYYNLFKIVVIYPISLIIFPLIYHILKNYENDILF